MRSSIPKALAMTTMLVGCANDIGAPTTDYCRIFEPIYWHPADTPETVRQIARENAKFACVCDRDCPAADRLSPLSFGGPPGGASGGMPEGASAGAAAQD